jgi:ABC-type Fe3+-siderophore transport system permease subunit
VISTTALMKYKKIMWIKVLQLTSIISLTIAFGSGFAHVLEAYNKMRLSKDEYQVVQQIYRGWALLGIMVSIALISTLLLTIQTRRQPYFIPNLLSCICILATLVIFFIFIFPVNQQTKNWEVLPDNWLQLRNRWEFSHTINAVIYFIGLLMLIVPLVSKNIK